MTLKVATTRARLASIAPADRCDDACRGWIISDGNHGLRVERCDDCCSSLGARSRVYDEDVRRLPEARAELRKIAQPLR